MAKGQRRSNREAKKPKQDKSTKKMVEPTNPFTRESGPTKVPTTRASPRR